MQQTRTVQKQSAKVNVMKIIWIMLFCANAMFIHRKGRKYTIANFHAKHVIKHSDINYLIIIRSAL